MGVAKGCRCSNAGLRALPWIDGFNPQVLLLVSVLMKVCVLAGKRRNTAVLHMY